MMAGEGVGLLGFFTMVFIWGFMAYPLWCAFHFRHRVESRHSWTQRVSLAATALVGLTIVPASLMDLGWALVPGALCLLAIDYIATQQVRMEARDTQGPCESIWAFWGLFAPVLLLFVLAAVVVVSEYVAAVEESTSAINAMRNPALVSFLILGVGPLATAAVYLPYSHIRRQREPR